ASGELRPSAKPRARPLPFFLRAATRSNAAPASVSGKTESTSTRSSPASASVASSSSYAWSGSTMKKNAPGSSSAIVTTRSPFGTSLPRVSKTRSAGPLVATTAPAWRASYGDVPDPARGAHDHHTLASSEPPVHEQRLPGGQPPSAEPRPRRGSAATASVRAQQPVRRRTRQRRRRD